MKAQRKKIITIKIAQKELGLKNDQILSGYGYASCSELMDFQADEVLEMFKTKFNWTPKRSKTEKEKLFGTGKKKYSELDKRSDRATPKQVKKIEVMWREIARSQTDESLRKFILKKTKVSDITFITKKQASNIINALEKMKQDKEKQDAMPKL